MLALVLVVAISQAAPKPIDWSAMVPAIRSALKAQFPSERIEESYSIGITRSADVADITADGVSEALIWLGTGGAYTDEMTLMRMEAEKPVVALFKDRHGKVRPMVFLRGASVMHGAGVDLLPEENAVYSSRYDYDSDGRRSECTGEAYQWNPHAKTFDYAPRLSRTLTQDYCSKVPKSCCDVR